MRNPNYQFIDLDGEKLEAILIEAYQDITGTTVSPSSPERLFLSWVKSIVLQERALTNRVANQNIPSRATGENLDALAELYFGGRRPEPKAAVCTERFYISEVQQAAVLVPAGTRVTDSAGGLVWETAKDAYIPIGDTYIDIPIHCQTPGTVGNGWAVGQINTIVDLYDYYSACSNQTVSADGADTATDDEFYQLMRASMDAHSTAGATGAYEYHAKRVSTEIADVVANRKADGEVALYVLMADGTAASTETKAAVLAACNADTVRPLTDKVSTQDPEAVTYTITGTYYIPDIVDDSAAGIQAAVDKAVEDYKAWQGGKLGRDINPSQLIGQLMQTGIKRVDLTGPGFRKLRDGRDNTVPQFAKCTSVSLLNGGHESE